MRHVDFTRSDTGKTRVVEIRALKRREIRDLKDVGYNCTGCLPQLETADDTVDRGLQTVLSRDDLDFLEECDNQETIRCWQELLKETYGSRDEEKNLSATSGGIPTDGGLNTANPAKDMQNSPPPA